MSSMAMGHDLESLPVETSGYRAPAWWGMVLLIVTEASLFACLIAGYFYLRAGHHVWPPHGIARPVLTRPIIMTVLLVISSAPMAWAVMSIRRGNRLNLCIGLALTFLLGLAFIGLQAWEYHALTFAVQTNAYTSSFVTIDTLDGLHVIGGLLALVYLFARALLGHFRPGRYLAVQNIAIYWHFVAVLWLVIFICLYLSPYFLQ